MKNNEAAKAAWGRLQFEAKARGVTVTDLLKERGQCKAATIKIAVPTAFLSVIAAEFAARDIRPGHLAEGLVGVLLASYLDDDCAAWSGYCYPSRRSACRAATRVFASQRRRASLVLRYRTGHRIEDEVFRNPLRHLKAA